jgi:PhnB protein
MAVAPIPQGFHSVTPYLIVKGAAELLDFLKQAFDAQEIFRATRPDGTIAHAQVKIGDSFVELSDAHGEWMPRPSAIHLYVNDADAVYQRAIRAGASSLREPADQFYGDREGDVKDPCGNHWFIATHQEDVPLDELRRREEALLQQQQQH